MSLSWVAPLSRGRCCHVNYEQEDSWVVCGQSKQMCTSTVQLHASINMRHHLGEMGRTCGSDIDHNGVRIPIRLHC